jgi:hypothetical protein
VTPGEITPPLAREERLQGRRDSGRRCQSP